MTGPQARWRRYYATYEVALRRVEALKAASGVWPGIAGPNSDGTYSLTYDPGDTTDA